MSSIVRLILVFIAAAIGAVMAPDVLHVLPLWAQVVAGALAAGLAGVGVVPPQYTHVGYLPNVPDSTYVKSSDADAVKRNAPVTMPPPPPPASAPVHPWTNGMYYDGRNSLGELLRE